MDEWIDDGWMDDGRADRKMSVCTAPIPHTCSTMPPPGFTLQSQGWAAPRLISDLRLADSVLCLRSLVYETQLL